MNEAPLWLVVYGYNYGREHTAEFSTFQEAFSVFESYSKDDTVDYVRLYQLNSQFNRKN